MKGTNFKKLMAAALSSAMICSVSTAVYAVSPTADMGLNTKNAAETGKVIFSTDFEDGDVSAFTNRGDDDTTEISTTTDDAVSGSTSLLASGRTKDWNGPAFRLDTICEPYTEYYISASVKGRYYTNAIFSFQFTNSDGKQEYKNLVQNLNGADWQRVENIKVSFTDEVSEVYVYFEGGQDDLFIDDFSVVEVPPIEIEYDIPSLKDAYNDFKIGTAITADNLSSKSFMNLVSKHFSDSMTVGNEMKPDSVLNHDACLAYVEETGDDTNPQVSFSKAKGILNYCNRNNIPMRIHTLVWHSQTPDWFFKENYDPEGEFVSSEKMLKRMENYIKNYFETLIELYPDIDFYACDVVNEAWLEDGKPRSPGVQGQSGSSNSAWVQVFGDNSFIEPAFEYARKYAPEGCKLYYNDYNEYMDGKMNAILAMAADLKAKDLIDGIGMQSHLDVRQSLDAAFPSIGMYERALKAYSETGLDIQITELDVTVPENSGDQYLDLQAEYYSGIMDAIVKYKDSVSAVIFWGVTDDLSWRAKQQPLIFDSNYQAKPSFYSIIDGIEIPDPIVTTTTTTAPIITTTTTTTPNPSGIAPTLPGDANNDGDVNMADAVIIMQSLANPNKYTLSAQGEANGDVSGNNDGITNKDALAIQKYKLGLITSLPETSAE